MDYQVEKRMLTSQTAAAIREVVPLATIGQWMSQAFGEVMGYLGEIGVAPAGMPFSRYFSMEDESVDVESGFPTAAPVPAQGRVYATSLPGGPVAVTTHMGPYETASAAYQAIQAWMVEHGRQSGGPFWEVYYTDPNEVPDPAQWRTDIFQPLAP